MTQHEHARHEGRLSRELAEAEERQRMLLRSLPDTMIALFDADLRCLLLDGPLLADSRLDPEICNGLTLGEILPADQAARLEPLMRAALGGEARSMLHTGTSGRYFDIDAAPYRGGDGEIAGAFAVARDVTDRLRREHEREDALRDLAEAQRLAAIGSWSLDTGTGEIKWSAETYRIFGRDPDQGPPPGRSVLDYVHVEDRTRVFDVYTGKAEGAKAGFDYRIVREDGSERVVHALSREHPERPGTYIGTVQDVTELRAVERALAATEHRLHSMLENAPIGMALLSRERRYVEVNRALCEITGYSEHELLGRSVQEITHPDDLEQGEEGSASLLSGELNEQCVEKRYLHKDGHSVWVEVTAVALRSAGDGTDYLLTQVKDISAERAAHLALEASERRYESIAANVPGLVFRLALSPDGQIALPFVSDGARELYGREPAELTAHAEVAVRAVHPEDRAEYIQLLLYSAASLKRCVWRGRLMLPDGQVKYVHGASQPVREPDGTVIWDGLLVDETGIRVAQEREAETRQRLERVLENLAGSAVELYDRELRLRFCEGPLFAGLDLSGMLGRRLPEFASQEITELLSAGIEAALDGRVSSTALDSDPLGRTLAVHFAPYRMSDGSIEGALVHWQDVSAVRAVERQRDEALGRFQVAFERAPIGMMIITFDGRFERVNEAMCELTGYTREELLGMQPFSIIAADDVERVREQFRGLPQSEDSMMIEHRMAHADGHPLWVQVRATAIRDDEGQPLHVLAQVQDISDRRSYEDRLKHMADHDPLTGLLNRRGLEAALEAHLVRCRRYGPTGALLVLDLDGFKFVNDMLGHAVGDELIVECAQALTRRLRESDTIARLGGDEFAVVLPNQSEREARIVAQALIQAIRDHAASMAKTHPGRVTASIGVALFSETTLSADEILVNADLAMYDAKEAGKDRYTVYGDDGDVVPKIKMQMTWLERIERALAEERFVLYAQPIVEVKTGRVAQHEVLVRMVDEHGDLIPPNSFLPVAERFGVVRQLDRWIVTRAIRTMAEQRAHGRPLSLAVNISALSTGDPELLETIATELAAGDVPAGDLTLEVTETTAVTDISRARRFAEALTGIGCRLALDDFGAGFGSFYYLKHLPFDVVKLDGEFVRHATENQADRLVIKAISEIAQGLGKETVAEFVPDEKTLELLAAHGIDFAQGYHLGRPVPIAQVVFGEAEVSGLPAS